MAFSDIRVSRFLHIYLFINFVSMYTLIVFAYAEMMRLTNVLFNSRHSLNLNTWPEILDDYKNDFFPNKTHGNISSECKKTTFLSITFIKVRLAFLHNSMFILILIALYHRSCKIFAIIQYSLNISCTSQLLWGILSLSISYIIILFSIFRLSFCVNKIWNMDLTSIFLLN